MPILDDWLKDLPQQYQGKTNIEVLITAFAKQLQEVEQAFADINDLTDLGTATGENLDYVGSILSLSRKEAGILAGSGSNEPVMSDERYRQYLKFQLLKNTNECTYYDLMDGAKLLWDVSSVLYIEEETYPATIILQVPLTKEDGTPTVIGEVPIIKPAGVAVLYQYKCGGTIEVSEHTEAYQYKVPMCGELVCGTYPYRATLGHSTEKSVELESQLDCYLSTPRLCGTYPEIATVGHSAGAEIQAEAVSASIAYTSKAAGQSACGTAPSAAAVGVSVQADVSLEQNAAGAAYTPAVCNTKYCGQEV